MIPKWLMAGVFFVIPFGISMGQKKVEPPKRSVYGEKLKSLEFQLRVLNNLLKSRLDIESLKKALKERKPVYKVFAPKKKKPAKKNMEKREQGKKKEESKAKQGEQNSSKAEEPPTPELFPLPKDEMEKVQPDKVILRVEGQDIKRSEWDELSQYLTSYMFDQPPEVIRRKAIEELIVRAYVMSKYKDKLPGMRKRIEAIRKRIVEKGEIFADVARETSDCPSKDKGGDLGEFGREDMDLIFARHAFALGRGKVSQPFITPFGYHIIKVLTPPTGMDPKSVRVRARHILVAFDKDMNKLMKIIEEARSGKPQIVILDSFVHPYIPEKFKNFKVGR